MKMQTAEQITISNIPEISAICFALLQSGYDYYWNGRKAHDLAEPNYFTRKCSSFDHNRTNLFGATNAF